MVTTPSGGSASGDANRDDCERALDVALLKEWSRRTSLLQRAQQYRRKHGRAGLARLARRQLWESRPRDLLGRLRTYARTGGRGYVINFGRYGFFANVFEVLGHVEWCERNGRVPLAYGGRYADWSDRLNAYWSAEGHNDSRNVWEYYFEPLSGIPIDYRARPHHADMLTADFTGICYSAQLYRQQLAELEKIRERDPDAYLTPFARSCGYSVLWRTLGFDRDYPSPAAREAVHGLMKRHVRINDVIARKIDDYYARHMRGRDVVGVQVRRTDHVGAESLPLELDAFFGLVDAHSREGLVFVATDCRNTLDRFVARYGPRVLHLDASRSEDGIALHSNLAPPRGAAIGEQVLMDAVLLSRTRLLIHGLSNVASAAMFMNPQLPCLSVWNPV